MATNDSVLLLKSLERLRLKHAPELNDSEYFEQWVAEEVLKDHALSYDEVSEGLVGGGRDGGVDGFWIFVNGEAVHEDFDFSSMKSHVALELVVIQAKRSKGFEEAAIDRLIATTENLLDLSRDFEAHIGRYSEGLLGRVRTFREAYEELAHSFPSVRLRYVFATLGAEVHPNTRAKSQDLLLKVQALFSAANAEFDFLGARELVTLARRRPRESYLLKFAERPLSSEGDQAHVGLVALSAYYGFLCTESGELNSVLFESNVRDYQGKNAVNDEILNSLRTPGDEDFWWLNNGITILATKASPSGKGLTLQDPRIVNGLQTSSEIAQYFSEGPNRDENRHVLVRVVVPSAPESRDRIIKATNSQTNIPPATLKATEKIHGDIEQYLLEHDIFYDRRKNYYKNQGKPQSKIIGIAKMAQVLMAVLLASPDTARARPSSLIKRRGDYERLFDPAHPIAVYLAGARIIRAIELRLREREEFDSRTRNNIRFYVALELVRDSTGEKTPGLQAVAALAHAQHSAAAIDAATDLVYREFQALGGTDQVAKGVALKSALAARR